MADEELDARGTWCPVPIIEAAKVIRTLPQGSVLTLRATDPGIATDLPAWCDACGHRLLSLHRAGSEFVGRVEKGAGR